MLTHTALFERFEIEMTKEQALSGSHPGDCSDDIKALLRVPEIAKQLDSIPADKIGAELEEYGAWEAEELADEQANKERILWIACGNIRDDIAEMERESKR